MQESSTRLLLILLSQAEAARSTGCRFLGLHLDHVGGHTVRFFPFTHQLDPFSSLCSSRRQQIPAESNPSEVREPKTRTVQGLPWWLSQYSVCLQCGRPGFNPWVGKKPCSDPSQRRSSGPLASQVLVLGGRFPSHCERVWIRRLHLDGCHDEGVGRQVCLFRSRKNRLPNKAIGMSCTQPSPGTSCDWPSAASAPRAADLSPPPRVLGQDRPPPPPRESVHVLSPAPPSLPDIYVWGLPVGSSGQDATFPAQGAQVQSLVRELRSTHCGCSQKGF